MTPGHEDAAIIQELVAILPEVKEEVGDLELVYEVAGAFALRLRDLIRAGAGPGDDRVRRAFALLEDLARRESVNAQEIAAYGVMEVIMDFPEVDPVARSLLGDRGTALWEEVRRFWYGTESSSESPRSPTGD
jgi:hypothetical protein